jgi:4-methoxybenzoate monooxygenase (O-demethylating)
MRFDPFAPAFLADPYPFYDSLRREAPCHHDTTHDVRLVSRHADVTMVLRDPRSYSSNGGAGLARVDDPERGGILISTDPPRHTAMRRVVQNAFQSRTAELTERIEVIADQLVDRALAEPVVDVISGIAEPLPVAITAELLGLDPDANASYAGWSDAVFRTMGPMASPEALQTDASVSALVDYLMPVVVERRYAKGGLADAILGGVEKGTFSFGEAFSLVLSVFAAGIDTTMNAVGNGLAALIETPAAWDALRRSPELVPSAVEEMLRYDAPIQAFFRTATADREIAGTTIPEGARVMALFGAANRDPSRYRAPNDFDVTRNPPDQLAFGAGVHLCLGAPLARLEMQAILRALVRRVARIERAGEPIRRERAVVRGFERLPAVLHRDPG